MSAQKSPAPVKGADAPSTDAPVRPPVTTGDVPAPATTPVRPLTKADARRARAAEQAAKAEKAEKFTLDAGAEWHECVGKAEIGVCNSIANAAGAGQGSRRRGPVGRQPRPRSKERGRFTRFRWE
jgi:hypothetical protein